jgi:hypothetical protein
MKIGKKQHWFSFGTDLERKSWKSAIEDAKILCLKDIDGSATSPLDGEITVFLFIHYNS